MFLSVVTLHFVVITICSRVYQLCSIVRRMLWLLCLFPSIMSMFNYAETKMLYLQYRKYYPKFWHPSSCLYVLHEILDSLIFQQELDNDRINPSCVAGTECWYWNNIYCLWQVISRKILNQIVNSDIILLTYDLTKYKWYKWIFYASQVIVHRLITLCLVITWRMKSRLLIQIFGWATHPAADMLPLQTKYHSY